MTQDLGLDFLDPSPPLKVWSLFHENYIPLEELTHDYAPIKRHNNSIKINIVIVHVVSIAIDY